MTELNKNVSVRVRGLVCVQGCCEKRFAFECPWQRTLSYFVKAYARIVSFARNCRAVAKFLTRQG